jgi:hypothetical protein
MVRRDHGEAIRRVRRVVGKLWLGPDDDPSVGQQSPRRVERDASETNDDSDARQRGSLRDQMRMARRDFGRRRFVVGRRAANSRGDVGIAQRQAIVWVLRGRNVRETIDVHSAHQEITRSERPVTGEHATSAVGAVRGWRKPNDQNSGARITKTGDRPSPVGLVAMCGFLLRCDALAVSTQALAVVAIDNLLMNVAECRHGRGELPRDEKRTALLRASRYGEQAHSDQRTAHSDPSTGSGSA